jgi:hypothetical protein
MTIVTPTYRPKQAPKKRKQPEIANRIVTPAPMQPRKGPVIRLREPGCARPMNRRSKVASLEDGKT